MVPSGQAAEKPVTPEPELKSWRFLVSFLCFYGFMAQMRPGESFITPYLLGPDKNFTQKQVTNEIIPVLSYSYLAVLVPVFLLTDYLRYTPVLVLQGLSYMAAWLLLLWGTSVLHMQLLEACYGVGMATRVAYSAYVFALVRPARFQRAASCSRAAVLLGVFGSSVLGQLLVTAGGVSFAALNHVSLGFLLVGLVLALLLRRPRRSLFFHVGEPGPPARGAWRRWVLVRMLRALRANLRAPALRLWTLWWVFNSTGYYLIVYYAHILWAVVQPAADASSVYNGGVDAVSTLLSAITAFAAGFVDIHWALWAKLVIAVVTAAQAGLVFLLYSTRNIWLCYLAYVLFRSFYQFLMPIATFQIASSLSKELCALVFGVNTLLATILNTIITLIVSDKWGLSLPVHSQFLVYFMYFLALSVAYLGAGLWDLWHFQRGRHQPLPLSQELRSPLEEKAAQALSTQPEALPLAPDDSTWTSGPASREQSQQPEAKA